MDEYGEQDISNEEGTETTEVTEAVVEETKPRRGRKPKSWNIVGVGPAAPLVPSLDKGDWLYRPWQGIPHWVNRVTGASTFDINKAVKP